MDKIAIHLKTGCTKRLQRFSAVADKGAIGNKSPSAKVRERL